MKVDINKCHKYLEEKFDEVVWSPSRLGSYNTCPYSFYLQYIEKITTENYLAYTGGGVHNIFEDYYNVGYTIDLETSVIRQTLDKKFDKVSEECPHRKPRWWESYEGKIRHGLQCFTPLKGVTDVERTIHFEVEGYLMKGILDLERGFNWHYDYKSTWDVDKYTNQQYLYMFAKEWEEGKAPKGFKILEYKNQMDEVTIPYRKTQMKKTLKWTVDTIEAVKKSLESGVFEKTPENFFCTALCKQQNCEFSQYAAHKK
jgi:hypothetical protein